MLEQILELDKQLFLFLNNLGTPTWDGFWMFYTDKLHWIPFYAVLFFFMYKKRNDKSIILTAVVVALMILFTDQITNLSKENLSAIISITHFCMNLILFSISLSPIIISKIPP